MSKADTLVRNIAETEYISEKRMIGLHKLHLQRNQSRVHLRWLDTVFKKLSYSLLNTLNFRTVKFK